MRDGKNIPGAAAALLSASYRLTSIAVLGLGLGFASSRSLAQEEPAPQEPDWSQSTDAVAAPETATDDAPPPKAPSAQATSGAGAPSPGPSAAPATGAAVSSSTDSATSSAGEPADAQTLEEAVGVPAAKNWFLPDFSNYGRPIFERRGLKFRLGPMNLRMGLTLGAEYNSNIYGSHTDVVADEIMHVVPTLLLGLGDYSAKEQDFLRLDYKPSIDYYAHETTQDRVYQNLEVAGQATFSKYSTEVELSYATSNQPNGSQSGGVNYGTLDFNWSNSYYLTGKTFARLVTGATIQNSENSNNYQTIMANPQVGYVLSPKTTVFGGPFAGIAYIGDGGTQTFQGVSVGFTYTNLRKLVIGGSAGIQARQFHGFDTLGAKNFVTPVFELHVTYQARQNTSFTLDLSRDVQISDLLRGLTYTSTQVNAGVSQKLLGKLSAGMSFGYQILDYQGTGFNDRTDHYGTVAASLGCPIWKDSVNLSVNYRYQKRSSDFIQNEYYANICGINLTWQF